MKILESIKRSTARPLYLQLDYAETCLESDSWLKSTLAAVNMGWYPLQSKEDILEDVQKHRENLEQEYPCFQEPEAA